MYRDLLGRAPDAGAAGFNAQLDSGTPASTVAYELDTSVEYRFDLVQSYYNKLLHRQAGTSELQGWVSQLAGGSTDEYMQAEFVASGEYAQLHSATSNNLTWLNAVYQDLLGRQDTEQAHLSELNGGASRQSVALSILTSTEFCTDQVSAYYQKFLGRSGQGDPGAAAFAGVLQSGQYTDELVIATLVGSHEYATYNAPLSPVLVSFYHDLLNRGTDPGAMGFNGQLFNGMPASTVAYELDTSVEYRLDLVQSYYNKFLHRQAGTAELQGWVNQLAGGATDEYLEAEFVASAEYAQLHSATSNNLTWLNAVYQDLLGRQDTEQAHLSELNGGASRQSVALSIMASSEFCTHQVSAYYWRFLYRSGQGDPGMAGFAGMLQNGQVTDEVIIADLLGSAEYANRFASTGLTLSPSDLPAATASSAYGASLSASGGSGSYTFAVTAGTLPAWLTLNGSTGALTGTPTTAGTSAFTITATDANINSLQASVSYALTVNPAGSLTISPASLPAATINSAYGATVSATGGSGTYTYAVTAGSLPAWLLLNASTGALTGTPTAGGSANFTLTATDAGNAGLMGSKAYTLNVNALAVNPVSLSAATANTAYSATVSATGGSGTYTYAVTAGTLPAWLSLNSNTGALTGTPTTSGSASFTVTATDSGNNSFTGSRAYTLTTNGAATLTVSPSSLSAATANSGYSTTVNATGGSGTYTYALTAGTLPAWLSLNTSTGALTGTPTTSGSSSFTITATDSSNVALKGSKAYSLTVNAASTLTVSPSSLSAATANSAFTTTVGATGGSGTYTYAVTTGSLPVWLSLNTSTGALTGTPTTTGSASFTITATDTANTSRKGSQAYALTVNAANTLTISPTSLPGGTVGTAYSVTPSATGGSGNYTFSVTAGSLPNGLSLNAGTGALSGTPSATGTFNFTLTATDSANSSLTGSRAYTVVISQGFILQNFDGSNVPVNGDGTYPDEYSGSGNATLSLDSSTAISGKSLDVHLTNGRLTLEFNPYNYSGVPGFPDNRGFARDYGLNPSQWQYNTYDRMSFWVWMPTSDTSYVTDGSHDIEFGTYVKQLTNPDNTSDEAGGTHYYHELNIPNLGVWTQVILNMHPDHQRNDPGSVDPGVIAYPTSPAGGNGGTDPASTYNYFDTLTRFYFDEPYTPPSSYPTDYRFDNIQFYKSAYQENDTQVYSLTGSYQAANNRLVVTWNRDKAEDTVVQEVRYSFTDIHASGWAAATPAPSGSITPPGGGAYNGMVYDTTQLSLSGHSVVYIAIKPQNSNLFTEIAVPLNVG
jgi:hypothetical protein